MVRSLLEARLLPGLPPYDWVQAEVRYGADGKSRVDFVLRSGGPGGTSSAAKAGVKRRRVKGPTTAAAAEAAAAAAGATAAATAAAEEGLAPGLLPAGQRPGCFLEVKSVTLAEDGGQARWNPRALRTFTGAC